MISTPIPAARRPRQAPLRTWRMAAGLTGAAAGAAMLARADGIRQNVESWAADLESTGVRRGLQITLGLAWLIDAALQLQPYMFGKAFVTQILAPAAAGNPAVIAGPAIWAGRLITHDVAAWNTAFAVTQLGIAVGLLWRPAARAALAGSVVWSLAVWWLGEGLGGVLTGTATPVTGAPGAVILYALIAILVWPRRSGGPASRGTAGSSMAGGGTPGSSMAGGGTAGSIARSGDPARGGIAAAGPLGSRRARAAWLVLWGSFAYLILQAPVRAPGNLRDTIARLAAGEPGWIAAMDRAAAAAAGSRGTVISVVLAAAFVFIAVGILIPATSRPALVLAGIAALAFWVVGQDFGAILTGHATDVSTGPLLIVLAAAYWPLRPAASVRGTVPAASTPAGQLAS